MNSLPGKEEDPDIDAYDFDQFLQEYVVRVDILQNRELIRRQKVTKPKRATTKKPSEKTELGTRVDSTGFAQIGLRECIQNALDSDLASTRFKKFGKKVEDPENSTLIVRKLQKEVWDDYKVQRSKSNSPILEMEHLIHSQNDFDDSRGDFRDVDGSDVYHEDPVNNDTKHEDHTKFVDKFVEISATRKLQDSESVKDKVR